MNEQYEKAQRKHKGMLEILLNDRYDDYIKRKALMRQMLSLRTITNQDVTLEGIEQTCRACLYYISEEEKDVTTGS
ncbi:MAG: hypothetical protein EOM19_05390 [Candidatus Moranbacteria bacterium]|nr:hypothetical protein [Candidatus Moranbacteria bacterium]